eukprot:gene2704-biopygen11622
MEEKKRRFRNTTLPFVGMLGALCIVVPKTPWKHRCPYQIAYVSAKTILGASWPLCYGIYSDRNHLLLGKHQDSTTILRVGTQTLCMTNILCANSQYCSSIFMPRGQQESASSRRHQDGTSVMQRFCISSWCFLTAMSGSLQ